LRGERVTERGVEERAQHKTCLQDWLETMIALARTGKKRDFLRVKRPRTGWGLRVPVIPLGAIVDLETVQPPLLGTRGSYTPANTRAIQR